MNLTNSEFKQGWSLGRSIALELDTALSVVGNPKKKMYMVKDMIGFLEDIPQEWRREWSLFLGRHHSNVTLLGSLARFANVMIEGNYNVASLAMRKLSLQQVADGLLQEAKLLDVEVPGHLDNEELVTELMVRCQWAVVKTVGLNVSEDLMQSRYNDARQLARLLSDTDLHTRFWLWLDRFYFEFYSPWRNSRSKIMSTLENRAIAALGSREKTNSTPNLEWLPPQHPLKHSPEIRHAIESGTFKLFLWVEPFGLFDSLDFSPSYLIVSFAEPEGTLEHFLTTADNLATRVKALSDPTRLSILRIIRFFGMDNTEMANYFELARPTVSNHAKVLREAGLIRTHQVGRRVRHEIDSAALRELTQDLIAFLDLPDQEE